MSDYSNIRLPEVATAGEQKEAVVNDAVNALGVHSVLQLEFSTAPLVWTNQPAILTELFGLTSRRTKFDLTGYYQVRLVVNRVVAGVAGAKLRGEYSTDNVTFVDLETGGGSGPEVAIDATGLVVSAWNDIPAGAQADVYLRIIGISGDGAVDPELGLIGLQFK